MGKFDQYFEGVMEFVPCRYYISRNVYPTKEKAQEVFRKHLSDMGNTDITVSIEDIKEAYVRFQPTDWGLRDEIGTMAWIVCGKDTKRAQPCWVYNS